MLPLEILLQEFGYLDKVIPKVRRLRGENSQFRHNSVCVNGNEILQNEITGTQTSVSTNFSGKLSFIPSFIFPEHLRCCYTYFHCSCMNNYYNYSQTLYMKC